MKTLTYFLITGSSILFGWYSRTFSPPAVSQAPAPPTQTTSSALPNTENRTDLCIALAEGLTGADAANFREYAMQIVALRPADEKIWKVLFQTWFAQDPASAWDFANHQIDRKTYPSIYRLAISTWASIDPRAASQALVDSSPDQKTALLESALLADPKLALSLIQTWDLPTLLEHSIFDQLPWENWIFELAKENPTELTEVIEKLENPDLLGAYFAGRAMADPTTALHWLAQQENPKLIFTYLGNYVGFASFYEPALMDFVSLNFPMGDRRLEVMRYALEHLATDEPKRAADETQRLFSDPHEQAEILAIIAEDLLRTDFDAAWEVASRIDSSIHSLRRVSIPSVDLSSDGALQSHPGPIGYQSELTGMRGLVDPSELKAQLLTKLLMVDRSAAIHHLSSLSPEDLVVIGPSVLDRWIWYEPKEALTFFAKAIPPDIDPENIWRLMNFGYSQELIQNAFPDLPHGVFRAELAGQMSEFILDESPAQAVAFLKEEKGPSRALSSAYWAWASANPQEALSAIARDEKADSSSWESVVSQAFPARPDLTIEVISRLPSGENRDHSLTAIAEVFINSSRPIDATKWTLGIEDPEIAKKTFHLIMNDISMNLETARDPQLKAQMKNLISADENLSPDQRNRWLERIELEFQNP